MGMLDVIKGKFSAVKQKVDTAVKTQVETEHGVVKLEESLKNDINKVVTNLVTDEKRFQREYLQGKNIISLVKNVEYNITKLKTYSDAVNAKISQERVFDAELARAKSTGERSAALMSHAKSMEAISKQIMELEGKEAVLVTAVLRGIDLVRQSILEVEKQERYTLKPTHSILKWADKTHNELVRVGNELKKTAPTAANIKWNM